MNAFSAYASVASPFTKAATKRSSGTASPALPENGDAPTSGETSTSAGSEDEETKKVKDSEKKDVEKVDEKSDGEAESFRARLQAQKDEEEESDSEEKLHLTEQEGE